MNKYEQKDKKNEITIKTYNQEITIKVTNFNNIIFTTRELILDLNRDYNYLKKEEIKEELKKLIIFLKTILDEKIKITYDLYFNSEEEQTTELNQLENIKKDLENFIIKNNIK